MPTRMPVQMLMPIKEANAEANANASSTNTAGLRRETESDRIDSLTHSSSTIKSGVTYP